MVASSESFTRWEVIRRRGCDFSGIGLQGAVGSWARGSWEAEGAGHTAAGGCAHVHLLITSDEFSLPALIRFRVF